MTMTMTDTDLRRQVYELRQEVDTLRAQLEGNLPKATSWLQWKVWRQGKMLDRLQKRVVAQRFNLRLVNELGRLPTAEEFQQAAADAEAWEKAAIEATA